MKSLLRMFGAALLASVLVMSACSKRQMVISHKAPDFTGDPPARVMVLSQCTDPTTRDYIEGLFSVELLKQDVYAATGFENLAPQNGYDPQAVLDACRTLNVDHVLTVRIISLQESPVDGPPPSLENVLPPMPFDGYISKTSAMGISTGAVKRRHYVRLQTRLFDLASGGQVWTARTRGVDPGKFYDMAGELSGKILAAMREDGVLCK